MTEKLSAAARDAMLGPLFEGGWAMVEGRDAIHKSYRFGSFVEAFGWMTRGQLLCLPMILAGLLMMVWAYRQAGTAQHQSGKG